MSLKVLGKWGKSMGKHWEGVNEELHGMHPVREAVGKSEEEEQRADLPIPQRDSPTTTERQTHLARKVLRKWYRLAGIRRPPGVIDEEGEDDGFGVAWCVGIAPRVEGRIRVV